MDKDTAAAKTGNSGTDRIVSFDYLRIAAAAAVAVIATAGVGTTPRKITSAPTEQSPAAIADSSISEEARVSLPITNKGRRRRHQAHFGSKFAYCFDEEG